MNHEVEELKAKVIMLEQALETLAGIVMNPEFHYKRPESDEHETLVDTLNYLHNKVKEHSEYFDNMIGDGK